MIDQSADEPKYLYLLDVAWRVFGLIAAVAMGSVAGYMIVGGLIGMLGLLLDIDGLVRYSPSVGWIAGAVVGFGNSVFRPQASSKKNRPQSDGPLSDTPGSMDEDSVEANGEPMRLRIPTIAQLVKSVVVSMLFGLIGGLITSVFLSLVLISVTTSPFAPQSWRPGTSATSNDRHRTAEMPANQRPRQDGAKVGTTFTHPLLAPICLWSTGSLVSVGLLAGIGTAFFTGNEDSIGFHSPG